MRSEERRALVLLGTAAIIASIYGAMLSAVWVHAAKPEDFYFNLPPASSPVRHATYYWIDILEYMLGFWLGYAFFAFWYFSADWLSPRVRETCRYLASGFMGIYVLYISAYIPLTYLDIVYVTDPYTFEILYIVIIVFILVLELDFVNWAVGSGYRARIPRVIRRIRQRIRPPRTPPWNEGHIYGQEGCQSSNQPHSQFLSGHLQLAPGGTAGWTVLSGGLYLW